VQCYKQGENSPIFSHLKKRFTEETGVDIETEIYGTLPNSKFPYKKFLKNANAKIIDYFRKRFSNV